MVRCATRLSDFQRSELRAAQRQLRFINARFLSARSLSTTPAGAAAGVAALLASSDAAALWGNTNAAGSARLPFRMRRIVARVAGRGVRRRFPFINVPQLPFADPFIADLLVFSFRHAFPLLQLEQAKTALIRNRAESCALPAITHPFPRRLLLAKRRALSPLSQSLIARLHNALPQSRTDVDSVLPLSERKLSSFRAPPLARSNNKDRDPESSKHARGQQGAPLRSRGCRP